MEAEKTGVPFQPKSSPQQLEIYKRNYQNIKRGMSNEEYREFERVKKADYRARKKLAEQNNEPIVMKKKGRPRVIITDECEKIIQEMTNLHSISRDTAKKYYDDVRLLHKKIYDKVLDCKDFTWLKNIKLITDFITNKQNYSKINTQKMIIVSILQVLRTVDKEQKILSEEQLNTLSKLGTNIDQEFQQKVKDNKVQKPEQYLKWNDILKLKDKIKKNDRLLYSLTTLFPRRNKDYRKMKVVFDDNVDEYRGKPFNYVVVSGNKMEFVFNQYKEGAKKVYGVQIYPVPDNLKRILRGFLDQYDNDELLFKNNLGKEYSQGLFSKLIQDMFEKYTGKRVGFNTLRHSFFTNYINNKQPSENELSEKAKELGTSADEARKYRYKEDGILVDEVDSDEDVNEGEVVDLTKKKKKKPVRKVGNRRVQGVRKKKKSKPIDKDAEKENENEYVIEDDDDGDDEENVIDILKPSRSGEVVDLTKKKKKKPARKVGNRRVQGVRKKKKSKPIDKDVEKENENEYVIEDDDDGDDEENVIDILKPSRSGRVRKKPVRFRGDGFDKVVSKRKKIKHTPKRNEVDEFDKDEFMKMMCHFGK
jgi:hypothetical protein